jgi:hypothetical protein
VFPCTVGKSTGFPSKDSEDKKDDPDETELRGEGSSMEGEVVKLKGNEAEEFGFFSLLCSFR